MQKKIKFWCKKSVLLIFDQHIKLKNIKKKILSCLCIFAGYNIY